jgi:hypothetical protein
MTVWIYGKGTRPGVGMSIRVDKSCEKFQEKWNNMEQNTIGLEQFQLLMDSEKNKQG